MTPSFPANTKKSLEAQIGRTGLQQVAIMFLATSLVNVLAYVFNILMGRMLTPASFGILISLQALLLMLTISGSAARTIVTKYVSSLEAIGQRASSNRFVVYSLQRITLFAALAALLTILLKSHIADFLRIASPIAVIVLALALIPTMVSSVLYGFLQGLQLFGTLGTLEVFVAALRILLGIVFVYVGFDAVGAVAALPVSAAIACVAMLPFLMPDLRAARKEEAFHERGLLSYSSYATIGLICFAVLTNMDMIAVKHFFSPERAGQYAAAATLGKIVFFLPQGVAKVLFPKSSRRYALNEGTSGLVRLSLLAVAIPCGLLTLTYFLWPSLILQLVFGNEYAVSRPVIGVLGVAMTLYGLANIWLNYYLSVNRADFLYVLIGGVVVQLTLLLWLHSSLLHIAMILAVSALVICIGGEFLFHRRWAAER